MEQINLQFDNNKPVLEVSFKTQKGIQLTKQEVVELNLKLTKWLLENNDLE